MKMDFEEHGNGKPVVLLHAFPLSRKMWTPQIESLVEVNCRVILPDFRGFGENTNFGDINTMEDLANDTAELLNDLKIEKAIIGGLSMGGYVLFNFFRLFPEKFAAAILADTNYTADSEEKRKSRYDLIEKIESAGAPVLIENMLPLLVSDFTKETNPDLVKELEAEFAAVDSKGAVAALRGMAEREDHTDYLEKFSVPTLLIFGENDKITNLEIAEKMHAQIKNSRFLKISNAGHYSNLEQPLQFNQHLKEFVQSIEI
jgi:pimeloyl-ACP methyl ester carboxylesterase